VAWWWTVLPRLAYLGVANVFALLDRTLIWNQSRLLHALREFEQFYNGHRPHQGIANARPLQPLPVPLAAPA
jgi:hypothetical protein